ncbi:MAG: hypothetical protein WD226_14435 [Planctomycetota bacterium]
MSQDARDLPEIPDHPEVPDDLPEIPAGEPQPLPEADLQPLGGAALAPGTDGTAAAAAGAASDGSDAKPQAESAPATLGRDEKPPLRELEMAPRQLGTAALIAAVGGILPWMGAYPGTWTGPGADSPLATWIVPFVVTKILAALGAYLWYQQVMHDWGPKLDGILGKLGDLSFTKRKAQAEADAPKRKSVRDQSPTTLKHAFPTALHLLALLLAVGAFVLPFVWLGNYDAKVASAEVGMFAWALFTWVHIRSYERWGSFNPIFPLMFLGMLVAGFARVAASASGGGLKTGSGLMGVMGGLTVGVAGAMAAYTMYLSLRQAKAEGDAKKEAALEARRAARASKRG